MTATSPHQIHDTLEYILNSIVTEHTNININQSDNAGTTLLTVTAPPEQIGQLIGKDGKIIKSIRILLGISYPNTCFNLTVTG